MLKGMATFTEDIEQHLTHPLVSLVPLLRLAVARVDLPDGP
jgi:hypothetical protein